MIMSLLLYSLIAGLFSLVGGILLLWKPEVTRRIMHPLISFGAGAFLAAAFADVLPEALEASANPRAILLATLAGFVSFFILERFLMRYFKGSNHHTHSEHTESLPFLLILSDCIHNFMDGVIIAIAFAANPLLGLPTAFAISAHEIPQEIGDFSILLHLKWKRRDIIFVNVLQSLLTIPGVFIGYFIGRSIENQLPLILGATAGIFIYIAGSDLIPELHHQSSHKHFFRIVLPMILSIVLVTVLAAFAEGH
jgi:zinc and cadmium transporter